MLVHSDQSNLTKAEVQQVKQARLTCYDLLESEEKLLLEEPELL